MAELSKGKQPFKRNKPSPLKHMQQVPDSGAVIPEAQLEVSGSHYGPKAREELDAETMATIERLAVKPSATTSASLPPVFSRPQPFGLVKSSSETTSESAPVFEFARRLTNKTPPKGDATAIQRPAHPVVAIPSIDPADNGAPKQGMSTKASCALRLMILQTSTPSL